MGLLAILSCNLGLADFSQQHLNDLMQSCEGLVEGNVKKAVESGVYQQYLVEKASQDLEDDKQAKRDE